LFNEDPFAGRAGRDQMNALGSWLDDRMTNLHIAAVILAVGATAALFYLLMAA